VENRAGLPLRVAYNSNGLKRHTIDEAISLLAELGYDGIELALQTEHLHPFRATAAEIVRVRSQLATAGLGIVCGAGVPNALGNERFEPSLFSNDPAGRALRLKYLQRSLEVASELGAEVLVFCTGGLAPAQDREHAWDWLVNGVRKLSEHGARLGLAVAVEPEPGHFVETLDDYRRLRVEVDHRGQGLAIDVGHLHCTESGRPEEHLARVLDDERLLHVQIDDMRGRQHEHLPLGEGEIDFEPVIRSLIHGGYRGLVGVELSRHSERADELAASSLAFLRQVTGAAATIRH
jgi:sugar phosphate isomerase/epimerase